MRQNSNKDKWRHNWMKTVRAAFRMVIFLLSTIVLHWFWFFTHFLVSDKIGWRQTLFGIWTRCFVLISNLKIDVTGKPPKPPFFLVTNHLGYIDVGVLRAMVNGVFVAKADVESWYFAGRICRDFGTIFVNRNNRRDILRAGCDINARLARGEGVIVFLEGTSSNGKTVLPFNSSFLEFATCENLPVHYASISYRTPPGELPASISVCWWDDISFFAHLWRLFKVRTYTATIVFGDEPITDPDRKALANKLRTHVAARLIPVV